MCTGRVLGAAATNEMGFRNTKTHLAYHVTGISQAAKVDLQKTDRVIVTVKQIRRITQEEGCVWAGQRADRHQERQ